MAIRGKKIKIVSRGMVNTSRGRCRAPILHPYVENVNTILQMLTRDKATIVEVLPDGSEVPLTIYNFSQDNTKKPEPKPEIKAKHVADPVVVNAGVDPKELKAQPEQRQLTRKERRELERKAREAAKAAEEAVEPTPEVVEEAKEETVTEEAPVTETKEKNNKKKATVEETTAVSEDAISE